MNNLKKNTVAYIDAANLHNGVKSLGWHLDYKRFRVWLHDKYNVTQANLFIGLIPKYNTLYTTLQEAGFMLIFKDVTYGVDGKVKGNCDADLVLRATKDVYESNFQKVILVSSDGDYAGLVSFLLEKEKLLAVVSPAVAEKCSILLKRTGARIAYLNDQKAIFCSPK